MSECNHDKISYLGQMIDESAKAHLSQKVYSQYEFMDLYNCVKCHTTIAIDRRKIGDLEKEIIKIENQGGK